MRSKAFTLIELLVVISIIGVIASIVLVSFSGSRDKAKLAKGQHFDAQISHALGAYAVGIWRFEEGGGTALHDESGYGNDGTINGAAWIADTPNNSDWALNFGGVAAHNVQIPINSALRLYNDYTVMMWINHRNTSNEWPLHMCSSGGGNEFSIHLPGRLIVTHNSADVINGGTIATNKWTHIAVTYHNGFIEGFINGDLVDTNVGLSNLDNLNGCLVFGQEQDGECGGFDGGQAFDGLIDDVLVYNESLSINQIQYHYAQGTAKHGIVLQ